MCGPDRVWEYIINSIRTVVIEENVYGELTCPYFETPAVLHAAH